MAVSVTVSSTRPVNTARSPNLRAARARGGAATGGAAACLGGRAPTVPSSSAEATGLLLRTGRLREDPFCAEDPPGVVVEGKDTRAFRHQEQQYRGPHQVHGPVFGVDEDLDHEGHAEERQGSEPRRQAGDDQRRARKLERSAYHRCDLGRQQWHHVLVAEQYNGGVPTGDFRQPRAPEHCRDGDAEHQLEDREREAVQDGDCMVKPDGQADAWAKHGAARGHLGISCLGEMTKPTASLSEKTCRSATVRSKAGSFRVAADIAAARTRPSASAVRNAKVPGSSRRQTTATPARRISKLAPPLARSIGGTSSSWLACQIVSIGQGEAK